MKLSGTSSYLARGKRTPVYGSDGGFIGAVKKVECDRKTDVFRGLVLSTAAGDRYLLGEQVGAVHADAVVATIPAGEAETRLSRHLAWTLPDGLASAHASWPEMQRWIHARTGLGAVEPPRGHGGQGRTQPRGRALSLARDHPLLALEAGVGRPDVLGAFDGGVVDINNAGVGALASLPGISQRLAMHVVDVRERIDGFSSLDDLELALDLTADHWQRLRGLVVFLPRQGGAELGDAGIGDPPTAVA